MWESYDISSTKVGNRYHGGYEVVKMTDPKATNPHIMALNKQVGLREDINGNGEWTIWKKIWTQFGITGAQFTHQSVLHE